MKVLVTGANGYLGMGIVKTLLNNNVEVIATDYSSENIDKRAFIKEADLFSVAEPYSFYNEPDVVLHLAWRNGFLHNAMNHLEDIPYHYSFIHRLINSNIKKVCVMGTMHEIGFYEGSINENTVCNPMSLYGIGKDALRKSINILINNSKTKFQWLRGYYIVGNFLSGSSIFSKIYQAEKKGEKEFPFTYGQNQWDFIDYNEFCRQVVASVLQDEILGIINICSGRPEKLADRVERFILENKLNIKLRYGAFPDRPYDSKAVWGDDKKIKMILNRTNIL